MKLPNTTCGALTILCGLLEIIHSEMTLHPIERWKVYDLSHIKNVSRHQILSKVKGPAHLRARARDDFFIVSACLMQKGRIVKITRCWRNLYFLLFYTFISTAICGKRAPPKIIHYVITVIMSSVSSINLTAMEILPVIKTNKKTLKELHKGRLFFLLEM